MGNSESVLVARDCNPAIGGLEHWALRGLSAADPHPRLRISIRTPHCAQGCWAAVRSQACRAVSGAIGWQALFSTGSSRLRLGISVWT